MIDPEQIRKTFERHRARAEELARWDLLGSFHFSTVAETNSVKITLSSELGDAAHLFPKALGERYVEGKPGAFSAPGRGIHFWGCNVSLTLSTTDGKPPPWDGGVQDALLKTIATELLPMVAQVSKERWTNSPFEENDPPPMKGDEARRFLLGLTEERVLVRFDLDYFTRPETANPDLEVVFQAALRYTAHLTGNPAWDNLVWMPPGAYRAYAVARVHSQPLCKWTQEKKRARDVLWLSAQVPIELRPMHAYRFAVGLPEAERALTEEERTFIRTPDAKLEHAREILSLRLLEERAKEAWGSSSSS